MATIVEAKNLADLYELPLVERAEVTARLDRGVTQAPETGGPDRHTCWLATIAHDDASLAELVRTGRIARQAALERCHDEAELLRMI